MIVETSFEFGQRFGGVWVWGVCVCVPDARLDGRWPHDGPLVLGSCFLGPKPRRRLKRPNQIRRSWTFFCPADSKYHAVQNVQCEQNVCVGPVKSCRLG
jgi:hypothetical protein